MAISEWHIPLEWTNILWIFQCIINLAASLSLSYSPSYDYPASCQEISGMVNGIHNLGGPTPSTRTFLFSFFFFFYPLERELSLLSPIWVTTSFATGFSSFSIMQEFCSRRGHTCTTWQKQTSTLTPDKPLWWLRFRVILYKINTARLFFVKLEKK